MSAEKNIYFASDFHLGAPDYLSSREREKKIVDWLVNISENAEEIYLLGDLFDFWFEYKSVVPKGFVRLIGKLAELSDRGIKIIIFQGNHDLWMKDYFKNELNAEIVSTPIIRTIKGKIFYLAHGDGLGPGDFGYKFINKVFRFKFNQFLFRWLHPDIGSKLARFSSNSSRIYNEKIANTFNGDTERLIIYSRKILQERHIDYFIYGHRHLPVEYPLNEKSIMFNLGDMFRNFTYGCFNGKTFKLLKIN